jgi:hypothetical protein
MIATLSDLICLFRDDPYSSFKKLRYKVRAKNGRLLTRIEKDYGARRLQDIDGRTIAGWHRHWRAHGRVAMAHSLVGQVRKLVSFGSAFAACAECQRLARVMERMRFEAPSRRAKRLTAEHVLAIRRKAHEWGWHSIAIAQTLQFELLLRQKDVIGEWSLESEASHEAPKLVCRGQAWTDGLCWEEIDESGTLRHITTARENKVEVDLMKASMVMEELKALLDRDEHFPRSGPIVVCESTGRPWKSAEYRRKWRIVANAAGVPGDVKNLDSRAGITFARIAGRDFWSFERPRPR